jgi:lysophospholipase L1-like esterase
VTPIGDSHFKEITTKVNQYLDTNVGVTGFIKPGATVDQTVDSQKTKLKCLGKEDLIVISGGANNLGNNSRRNTNPLVPLLQFAQNCSNTNVLMVTIPTRHDHPISSQINHKINNFDEIFSKRIRHFKHAHLLSMHTDRRYFTKHGQHLNKTGKERLAKDLAFTINEVSGNTRNTTKKQ